MKNVIAISACLKRCSVAISYKNQLFHVTEYVDAATNLAFLLQNLIRKNGISIKEIEGVITASGPGSFTGIRTAQSLAKALAMSLRIPSTSINYFDVIDYIAEEKKNNRLIIIKSKKNQAYFKKIQNGYEENGVSSYEQLIKKTEECDFLIGENIPEIYQLINSSRIIYKEIADFRNAKYLLNFSEQINKNSKIIPLYINAAMQASI